MTTAIREIVRGPTVVINGIRSGIIGMTMGVHDWNMSRLGEATKMVLYVWGDRRKAFDKLEGLRTIDVLSEVDVDAYFHVKHTVAMGGGVRPPTLLLPIKVELHAPYGFARNPMQTFDRAVDIFLAGDWDSTPELRERPKQTSGGGGGGNGTADDVEAVVTVGDPPFEKRLPHAPRMTYDGKRGYTPPGFRIPVGDYVRRCAPDKVHTYEDGTVLVGHQRISGYVKGANKPDKADVVPKRKPRKRSEAA